MGKKTFSLKKVVLLLDVGLGTSLTPPPEQNPNSGYALLVQCLFPQNDSVAFSSLGFPFSIALVRGGGLCVEDDEDDEEEEEVEELVCNRPRAQMFALCRRICRNEKVVVIEDSLPP